MFGRSKLPDLPHLAYELFSLVHLDLLPLPFQNKGLNWAAGCIRKYSQLDKDWKCYHIMVRAVAIPSFLRALEEEDAGKSQFLPFSCWCDGGKYREARHRQHRHMLLFSPVNHFVPNVWKRIKIARKDHPCKNFYCIRMRHIQSPMHLVNAMGYLSKRQSTCDSSFIKKGAKVPKKSNHFWIFKELPTNFRLYTPAMGWWHHAIDSSRVPAPET